MKKLDLGASEILDPSRPPILTTQSAPANLTLHVIMLDRSARAITPYSHGKDGHDLPGITISGTSAFINPAQFPKSAAEIGIYATLTTGETFSLSGAAPHYVFSPYCTIEQSTTKKAQTIEICQIRINQKGQASLHNTLTPLNASFDEISSDYFSVTAPAGTTLPATPTTAAPQPTSDNTTSRVEATTHAWNDEGYTPSRPDQPKPTPTVAPRTTETPATNLASKTPEPPPAIRPQPAQHTRPAPTRNPDVQNAEQTPGTSQTPDRSENDDDTLRIITVELTNNFFEKVLSGESDAVIILDQYFEKHPQSAQGLGVGSHIIPLPPFDIESAGDYVEIARLTAQQTGDHDGLSQNPNYPLLINQIMSSKREPQNRTRSMHVLTLATRTALYSRISKTTIMQCGSMRINWDIVITDLHKKPEHHDSETLKQYDAYQRENPKRLLPLRFHFGQYSP